MEAMTPVRVVITIAVCLGAVCLLAIMLTMPAKAQIACPPMAQLLNELQIRFSEFPLVTADIPGLKKMITVSRDGTFTEINVMPDGTGCIVQSGTHFQLHQVT
jgi:hypothetical protein